MSKKLLLLTTVFLVLLSFSFVVLSAAASMWLNTYGGAQLDLAQSLVETSDGGYAIAGWTASFGAGETDFWLVKTDMAGNRLWNRTYGGADSDWAYALVNTYDGGYALAGNTYSSSEDIDFWLVKTDAEGNMEWNRTYGGTETNQAYALVATSDGGYAIAGWIRMGDDEKSDFWLVKTDEFGNMEWNGTYGGTDSDWAHALVATSDGGYAIAGNTFSFGAGSVDFWLVKTDAEGNEEWSMAYGGTAHDEANSVVETSDGGYAIAGYTTSFGAGELDGWLVRANATGYMEWSKAYGTTGNERFSSVVATSDGGYAIAGGTTYQSLGDQDVWLVKTDSYGNMDWNQTYWGPNYDSASALIATSDGGYAIAGENAGNFYIIKTNEQGILPEYSSWLLPLILLVATSIILISKKTRFKSSVQTKKCSRKDCVA